MSIQLFKGPDQVDLKWTTFSDGAINVNVDLPDHYELLSSEEPHIQELNLCLLPTTEMKDAIWEIALVLEAIRQLSKQYKVTLHLPYLPNGRADRVFEKGDSLPLKAFNDILMWMDFERIVVTDPHSMKEKPFRMDVKSQTQCFIEKYSKVLPPSFTLVAPDKGAWEKTLETYKRFTDAGYDISVVQCSKVRDLSNGQIKEIRVPDVPVCELAIVVDDICDGGGTFIPIAEKLRENGAKRIDLYVTHGIFSKGLDIFKGKYDYIHCYQTVGKHVNHKHILDFNQGE